MTKLGYLLVSLLLVLNSFFSTQNLVWANDGFEGECEDAQETGFEEGAEEDEMEYSAPDGQIVTGVCIWAEEMFSDGHSDPLEDGDYEDDCYTIEGVGTNTVYVERFDDEACSPIDHLDIYTEDENGDGEDGNNEEEEGEEENDGENEDGNREDSDGEEENGDDNGGDEEGDSGENEGDGEGNEGEGQGDEQQSEPTPTPTPTPTPSPTPTVGLNSGNSASSLTPAGAPSCQDTRPQGAPILHSWEGIGSNKVKLSWTKASDPVSYYLISYGLQPNQPQYGNPNVGGQDTTSFVADGLSAGVTYYFRVRAGNGCMPGDYSNELAVKINRGLELSSPPQGFQEGVLSEQTQVPASPTPQPQQLTNNQDQNIWGDFLNKFVHFFKGLFL